MTDPWDTPADVLDHVWQILSSGVADRAAPARFPTLLTIGADGGPEGRTVALRAADRSKARLEMHTDLRSGKIAELSANPRAGLHIWAPEMQTQLRLRGAIGIRSGPMAEAAWHRVPDPSREAYGHVPPPGTPIARPQDWVVAPALDNFAVLEFDVASIDAVSLSVKGHRRLVFARDSRWAGTWLSP